MSNQILNWKTLLYEKDIPSSIKGCRLTSILIDNRVFYNVQKWPLPSATNPLPFLDSNVDPVEHSRLLTKRPASLPHDILAVNLSPRGARGQPNGSHGYRHEPLAPAQVMQRGVPEHILSGNSSEFTSRIIRTWLNELRTKTLFLEPGSSWKNGWIESFNGKLRDELLNREIYWNISEVSLLTYSN